MNALQIGDYIVQAELGSGSAGTAYSANHQNDGRLVAIKVLSPEMSADESMQRRFVREMSVMSKLQHPNVVQYIEGGVHDDRFYYVMEHVDSSTLKDILTTRVALSWQEAAECASQICEALQCAHDRGVIHRDLKPGNLFLSSAGLIKLGDFGLARDLGSERLTVEGLTVGTCRYMSPEQIAGHADLSGATDLYALGCLLYEMITGRVPYNGATTFEILDQHHRAAPPDARELAPNCPEDLAKLIQQLLSKKPEDRPGDANAVKRRLDAILQADRNEADASRADTSDADVQPAPNLTARLRAGNTEARREISWKPLVAIGLLIVAAIALYNLFGK